MKIEIPQPEMELAFMKSDSAYDGTFFTGVRTTHIFCRPSCPAKKPLRTNIEYFPTAELALAAGYRPCRRCDPLETGKPPQWITSLLARLESGTADRITDSELLSMGLKPVRVRRYFLKNYGLTFQAYCRSRRLGGALKDIRRGGQLDFAGLDHGYDSSSGFRDAFTKLFGRPPGHSRDSQILSVSWFATPLGPLLGAAHEQGLCALEFTDSESLADQLEQLGRAFSATPIPSPHPLLETLSVELEQYFSGRLRKFSVPLHYPGTPFQQRVWRALLEIPYGETRSYEDVARSIGSGGAVRAVGTANGANRIAVVIPCHRVVNKSGALGGYGGGLRRKEFLLHLEGR